MTSPSDDAVRSPGLFDPRIFFDQVKDYGHSGALGIRYVDHGEDWVETALPWREELVGVPSAGYLASGAIVSLIDLAGGVSVWIKSGAFNTAVTLDLRIDYLRAAAKGETIYARCRCIKLTQSIAFVEGIAHVGDRDDAIARAALTFMAP